VKLYLDENLSPRIAELLRAHGLDAVSAHEAGNTQLADPAQLRYATSQGRAIVTCDVADVVALATELIAANADHAGIVLVSSGFRTDDFSAIAGVIEQAARRYPDGIPGAVLYLSHPA
jgi:predicted nuclease of predicted toxin-antitoxin system